MKNYYHGSGIGSITQLKACSSLHITGQKVVYLTDNLPYALFYIWDAAHNGCSIKHVTGWTKNDIAYYEEQFSDQLKTFYHGVSGFVYCTSHSENIQAVENRRNMFYCVGDIDVTESIYIPDVYEELMKYEAEGKLVVLRYKEQSEERQNELIDFMAQAIFHEGFYTENREKREFMKKHFSKAWRKAELLK